MMEPPKIWREKRERYLALGTECMDCKSKSFPKGNTCLKCGSNHVKEYKISEYGKILLFSSVTQTAKEMMASTPHIIALVELDDGIIVTAQIVDCNYEKLTEGMKVKMVFRILSKDGLEGLIKYGFKFTPA